MAQSILVVSHDGDLATGIRTALAQAGVTGVVLDRAPSAALAVRILQSNAKEIDAVVVDLAEKDDALEVLRAVRAFPERILALASAVSPKAGAGAHAVSRVGGCSVFWRYDELPRMLQLKPAQKKATPPARLILFAPAQEGAGASTAALHAAVELVRSHGQRVLFAELDYHSDSVACRLQISNAKSLSDLEPQQDWRDVVTEWDGLHVLAAPSSTRILRKRGLPDIAAVLADSGDSYDLVVGDLPCNTAVATRQVLSSADRIYVVATAEVTSLYLARRRIAELCSVGADRSVIRLIINRDRPGAVDAELARQVTGLEPCCRLPNDFNAASEAETEGRIVSASSALAQGFAAIAACILGKSIPAKEGPANGWSRLLSWRG